MWESFLGPPLKLSNRNSWNSQEAVIKYDYLQSWEILSNRALLEFGLAEFDLLSHPDLKWSMKKIS